MDKLVEPRTKEMRWKGLTFKVTNDFYGATIEELSDVMLDAANRLEKQKETVV